MSCATGDGFVISMVTLPAGASNVVLSNVRAPLGSACSWRTVPPEPAGAVVVDCVLVEGVVAEFDSLEPPPQAASAIASTGSASTPMIA